MKADFEKKVLSDSESEERIKELKQRACDCEAKECYFTARGDELMRPRWKWWRRADAELLYWMAFLSKRNREYAEEAVQKLEAELTDRVRQRLAV